MRVLSSSIKKVFTICFIALLFSISAGAVVTSGSTQQYGLGNLDFESDSVGATKYTLSASNKYSAYRFLTSHGQHTSLTVAAQTNGNKYLQFKDKGVPKYAYGYNPYWQFYTNAIPKNSLGYYLPSFPTDTYDFFVFDFELSADAYVYTYTSESSGGNTTTELASIPADAQILVKKPAYPEGLLLANEISGLESVGAEKEVRFFNSIKVLSQGSDWYLYAEQNGVFVNTGAKLKSEINEWNHFTVVVSVDRTDGNVANSKQYTYLNGNLVATQSMTDGTQRFADFSNIGYKIEYPYEVANDSRYLYSFGLDNFSVNYYMRGDDGSAYSSSGYGLDDYFKDGNADKGIYNCEDIVYDNSYVEKDPVASVGGQEYYFMNAALFAVEENSTLKLMRSLENYTPTVKSMTVEAASSLRFSLSPEAVDYSYEKISENGIDTYIITYTDSEDDAVEEEDKLLKARVFDEAKYNLTTTTSFIGNFYVKVPQSEVDYEVFTGEGSGYDGIIDIYGVSHYKFCSEPLINDITAQITFNIKVKVDGETKSLKAEYTIGEYFAGAMAQLSAIAEPNEHQKAQMRLIMNAARYANELYKYINDTEEGYSEYKEILSNELYSKNLTSYDDLGISENEKNDFSEISPVVIGVGFAVHNGYSVSCALYVKDGLVNAESISVTYKSITGEILENAIDPTMIEQVGKDGKYYYFICRDIPIYEMISEQLISIEEASGQVLEGEYSLGAYIKSQGDSVASDLTKAMYAYAKSSYQYKIFSEE